MALKFAGFKVLRKKDHRILKNNPLLDTISKLNGGLAVSQTNEDGVVRMKIVVKKPDLKEMLKVMRGSENFTAQPAPSPFSVEQKLNLLRRRHLLRVNAAKESHRRGSWFPALESIPEEL